MAFKISSDLNATPGIIVPFQICESKHQKSEYKCRKKAQYDMGLYKVSFTNYVDEEEEITVVYECS